MKANAPEKIYLEREIETDRIHHLWGRTPVISSLYEHIEYTRTDAFIEKAIKYIITNIPDMHMLGVSAKIDECIIKDFRKYMEGE